MRTLLFLMLISLLAGCSKKIVTITTGYTPQPIPCAEPFRLAPQWYNQEHTYRLRHSGALQFKGRVIPMTGFMVLDTQQGVARIAILTGLGIKLATLEVRSNSYEIISSSPMAEAIPHLFEQCAYSIQRIFLTHFPTDKEECVTIGNATLLTGNPDKGTMELVIDRPSGVMTSKSFKSKDERWWIAYEGLLTIGTTSLPEKTRFTSQDKGYTVTLQLNAAEIQ